MALVHQQVRTVALQRFEERRNLRLSLLGGSQLPDNEGIWGDSQRSGDICGWSNIAGQS
jgi:hypothetical protein